MTVEQAKARLRLVLQPTSEPTLSDQDLDDLLAVYALEDEAGLAPDATGWVGTWDLQGAFRQGWLVKAGRVASNINYTVDGAQYSESDMHEHCMKMAQSYGRIGSISVGAS